MSEDRRFEDEEWRSDEDAVTMSTLLLVSFALGWSWPQISLLSGVLLGTIIPALNLTTITTGVRPAYETALQASTHHLSYVAGLLVLIGPAVAATSLGGVLRGR